MPFNDFTTQVLQRLDDKTTDGLQKMARNTVRVADRTSPFRSKGSLKADKVLIQLFGSNAIKMTWPVAWAQYQNRGSRADGSHRVRRYTTPGTGKGFVDKGVTDTKSDVRRFFA